MSENLAALEEFGLGVVMAGQGRAAEAAQHYRRALAMKPGFAEASHALADLFRQAGMLDEAEPLYRAVAATDPGFATAQCGLGVLLFRQDRFSEAVDAFTRALAADPALAAATFGLASALVRVGRAIEAMAHFRLLIAATPDDLDAREGLALALRRLGRFDEEAAEWATVAGCRSDDAGALGDLAQALARLGRFAEAETHLRRALELEPDSADHRMGLGRLFQAAGRLRDAASRYAEATALAPDEAEPRYRLATALLGLGDYANGWDAFEARLDLDDGVADGVETDAPPWDGTIAQGMRLLVYPERSIAGAIQFARFASEVAMLGVRITLASPPRLIPLFSGLRGIDRLVSMERPLPACDAHAPLMSLPGLLGTTLGTIPAGPCLTADPGLVRLWRERLRGNDDFKVGLVWRGEEGRSTIPLDALAGLRGRKVTLYSLQGLGGHAPVPWLVDLGPDLDRDGGLFMETAALMQNLDLVVAVDAAAADLAGALGRPVWLLLEHAAHWRWIETPRGSPWYPTARLFRQPSFGDWDSAVAMVAAELRLIQSGKRRA